MYQPSTHDIEPGAQPALPPTPNLAPGGGFEHLGSVGSMMHGSEQPPMPKQSESAQSVSPSESSSSPFPQISFWPAHAGSSRHSASAQSVAPSRSSSTPLMQSSTMKPESMLLT